MVILNRSKGFDCCEASYNELRYMEYICYSCSQAMLEYEIDQAAQQQHEEDKLNGDKD